MWNSEVRVREALEVSKQELRTRGQGQICVMRNDRLHRDTRASERREAGDVG